MWSWKRTALVLGPALWLFLAVGSAAAGDRELEQALEAVGAWLAVLDSGDYARTWEQAAAYVKEKVSRERWVDNLNIVRRPLGRVISRRLNSTQVTTVLPDAPEGEYFVIHNQTSFESMKDVLETITLMKDRDGTWRVGGYYLE
ncbi:MAG: DUF4019 domain-containing protein [Thermodesulfobacteriota bacterium]